MSRQAHQSALDLIVKKPSRRTIGEGLLKQINQTSYPHASLANLTVEYAKCAGIEDPVELNKIASELRPTEFQMGWLDFIRCIAISREGSVVKVVVKRLKLDPTIQAVNDHRDQHEFLAQSKLVLPTSVETVVDPTTIVKTLLDLFFTSQVRGRVHTYDISRAKWFKREKRIRPKGNSLKDLDVENIDTPCTLEEIHDLLAVSLKKNDFHLIMTQNTIFLTDQFCRIWCTVKEK